VAQQMKLGAEGHTDVIALSFSTLDKVGHDFGPTSHEIQDVLIRLDRTLGDLFAGLDRLAGPGHYVVALTADHGVAPIPERQQQLGVDAGRIPNATVLNAVEEVTTSVLGSGKHVARLINGELYFESGVYSGLRQRPGALRAVQTAVEAVPGVSATFTRDQLAGSEPVAGSVSRQLAAGYFERRSGDLFIVLRPYWLFGTGAGSGHGTVYRYDTHVPVLLMGQGITAGEYLTPASPLDIAPTLAFLAGITLPHAQGHVLADAVVHAGSSSTASR
jgi:predicted AlkP superfamily pyrophosphatase or phosphodiesterase